MRLHRPNPILEYVRTHKYNVMLAGICAACFALSVGLLCLWLFGADVPDVDSANPQQIGKFIKSEDFLNMPTSQRRQFVDGVVNKHIKMDAEERADAFSQFRQLRMDDKQGRDKMRQFFMDWGLQRANEYAGLPPEKKVQYVDNLLNMAVLLSGGKPPEMNPNRRRPDRDQPPKPDRMIKAMAEISRKTTAEERARATVLMGDVIARARYRFER